MTSVVTRSPLHHLQMNRRRSARHRDDDNDDFAAPPAKKSRTVANDTTRTMAGATKSNGAANRKGRKAYEEADEGFTFSRKRQKKQLPVTPEKSDAPKPRRSKRLSGDASPPLANGGDNQQPQQIHIPKRRETKIELVFSETPVIRRNKAMRQTSSDSNRRSSAGLRGKRASSLIDAGSSNAVPHTEVRTQDFYKHISQDLMEPRRMKQLLVWCANRALDEKLKLGVVVEEGERQAAHAARVVQEELLAEFANRSELSNWFDRPEDTTQTVSSLVKKPNPRNVQNAAKLAELEAEVARLQAEKNAWDSLVASVPSTSRQEGDVANSGSGAETIPPLDPTSIDASLLSPSQAAILATLTTAATNPAQAAEPAAAVQARLDAAAAGLRFKLDLYHDSLHRLERYVDTASRVADGVLARGAARLQERDEQRRERAAGPGQPALQDRDVLRALGKALDKSGPAQDQRR